jgi:hypothetical protein
MIQIEETVRRRLSERPRINVSESCDEMGESWHRQALIRYSDIVRLVGEEPEDRPCERWGRRSSCDRRPCEPCEERSDWEGAILDIVREATEWGLWRYGCDSAYDCTGRPFAWAPSVYRHARHRGVVVVSWSGGLDI